MPDIKGSKKLKLAEIKSLVENFCVEYLSPELQGYCFKLCDTLARKRKIDIQRGKTEIWVASIVYVIARLNFLFDPISENYITIDDICDFFGTNKSTTGNKATQIQKQCDLYYGAVGYCYKRISDQLKFYQTESGFIFPLSMLKGKLVNIEFTDDDNWDFNDNEEESLSIWEKRQIEKQKQMEEKRQKASLRKKDTNQLGLFDT